MQLLAKKPGDRLASAEAVLQRLDEIESGTAVANPTVKLATRDTRRIIRLGWAGPMIGAGLVVLLGVAAWSMLGQSSSTQSQPSLTTAAKKSSIAEVAWGTQPGVFLTDLKPVAEENWFPFVPRPPKKGDEFGPPKGEEKKPKPGIPVAVTLAGQSSPHGIFMHAVPPHLAGAASISYRLDKQYRTFYALVTLNDGPPHSESPMTFAVYGDGERLWQSKPVESQDDTQRLEVSVQGVNVLKIELSCPPGDVRGNHGAWIEPFLVK
jgi:hypothetical protein